MSGAFWGLTLGIGLACVWWSFWPREPRRRHSAARAWMLRLSDEIALAGVRGLTGPGLLAFCVATFLIVLLIGYALTSVVAIALAFAAMSAWAPIGWVRSRARQRRTALREVWPDVVDHVSSAVRAGLALPEALVQLADRGPEELREPFAAFAVDYRATGRFPDSLDRLKDLLSDPVADRLIEALRIARHVGGSDLGRVLRTLSAFLREDAHSRAEMEARQSWTVNAARLAMAAPWVVLLLMATRSTALVAYSEPTGIGVLALGGAMSGLAYWAMVRIGQLPQDERVLR
ncbi:type II secretion system F family protein [Ornithinimicrobium sp. Arc0846-15]|nr:type II secretion system F family protein [Ornithinimicrobium laminariae]